VTSESSTADTVVIVPTRGRSHLLPRLINSVRATAAAPVDIYLVVNVGEFDTYQAVIDPLRLDYNDIMVGVVEDGLDYPTKLNLAANAAAYRYKYMALWNDEHEPLTAGWDAAFKAALGAEPFGVACGPDGIWENGEIPSAPFMTTSFHSALGWVALPGLQHILVDNVWMDLAKALDVYHFLPEVRVQHHHRQLGAPDDDTYHLTNDNPDMEEQDRQRWWEWLQSEERVDNEVALAELWNPPRGILRPA
jgi:hypothetical protein